MNIQIFGTKKSADTRKAERYFNLENLMDAKAYEAICD